MIVDDLPLGNLTKSNRKSTCAEKIHLSKMVIVQPAMLDYQKIPWGMVSNNQTKISIVDAKEGCVDGSA